ncbi:GNAT family N-acetyltransferase [Streptomyces bambusae]|uniref:GNAT family N-acetyltransferase n=1 Tax=Streptomyces bambusae TaxID=1550616 RepID=UPI001CFD77AB|nr:GNAT family N-acetyltransferase [Streptomyces bambusae]MCB5166150.1 GNAT family N-acetyltransferase [Streptomyces bambusae]
MILEPLPRADGALPGPVLTEVAALYAANREFFELSGDFPDPAHITLGQVAAALADELAAPGSEVLLARSEGRLVGLAATLAHHPSGTDPDPWIGLLLVDAAVHRQGHGRRLAGLLEDGFRTAGRTGVRLAVLDDNPRGLAFWTAQGYRLLRRSQDLALGRPCRVLRKPLV